MKRTGNSGSVWLCIRVCSRPWFALLWVLASGCRPSVDARIASDYLHKMTISEQETVEFRAGVDEWLLLATHLEPKTSPLCDSHECQVDAAVQAVRIAATKGVDAAILIGDSSVYQAPRVLRAAEEYGLLLVGGEQYFGESVPRITLTGPLAQSAARSQEPTLELLQRWARETGANGGMSILRHPCFYNQDPASLAAYRDSFTAVEITGPGFTDPDCATALWHRWLQQGARVVGVAASARFLVEPYPYRYLNLVRSSVRTPQAVLQALAAGHVQVVRQASQRPRIHLSVDHGDPERLRQIRQGDLFLSSKSMASVRLRVVGGRHSDLVVYTEVSSQPVLATAITSNDQVLSYGYPMPKKGTGFLRAELYRAGELAVRSNPVYFVREKDLREQSVQNPSGAIQVESNQPMSIPPGSNQSVSIPPGSNQSMSIPPGSNQPVLQE